MAAPSVLEFFGFIYFPAALLAGPYVSSQSTAIVLRISRSGDRRFVRFFVCALSLFLFSLTVTFSFAGATVLCVTCAASCRQGCCYDGTGHGGRLVSHGHTQHSAVRKRVVTGVQVVLPVGVNGACVSFVLCCAVCLFYVLRALALLRTEMILWRSVHNAPRIYLSDIPHFCHISLPALRSPQLRR